MSLVRYSASLEIIQNVYMSKRYYRPKMITLWSPEKKIVISKSRLIQGRNIIYNVLEQMESVYA